MSDHLVTIPIRQLARTVEQSLDEFLAAEADLRCALDEVGSDLMCIAGDFKPYERIVEAVTRLVEVGRERELTRDEEQLLQTGAIIGTMNARRIAAKLRANARAARER